MHEKIWEGNGKQSVKQLETIQTAAAKKVPGCSSTMNNTVLRAELGMHPLKTNRGREKVEMSV